VITLTLSNNDFYRHTSTEQPLWLACEAVGALTEDDQLMGHYARIVAMKADWTVSEGSVPAYPTVTPGETRDVDFSTHFDWDYEPLSDREVIRDCAIGGSQFQAMMQMGVDPSDANRGNRYHYMMHDVTPAGRQRGYSIDGD
jgi:hypothetical protein